MASRVVEASTGADTVMYWLNEYASSDPEILSRMALNPEVWEQVKNGSERHQDHRNWKADATRKVVEKWGSITQTEANHAMPYSSTIEAA